MSATTNAAREPLAIVPQKAELPANTSGFSFRTTHVESFPENFDGAGAMGLDVDIETTGGDERPTVSLRVAQFGGPQGHGRHAQHLDVYVADLDQLVRGLQAAIIIARRDGVIPFSED